MGARVLSFRPRERRPGAYVVLHQNLPGKHVEEGASCWCIPWLIWVGDGEVKLIEKGDS